MYLVVWSIRNKPAIERKTKMSSQNSTRVLAPAFHVPNSNPVSVETNESVPLNSPERGTDEGIEEGTTNSLLKNKIS